jgi:hypothetical protein
MVAITKLNNNNNNNNDNKLMDHLDLEISPLGHSILGFLICLLLVIRVHYGVTNAREGRIYVEQMNRNAREYMLFGNVCGILIIYVHLE